MQSPIFESFNQDRSRSGQTDLCINLYPEHIEGPKGPEIGLLISAPGITTPLATVGSGPIRAEFTSKNGLLYVVSGNGLYSVTTGWVSTLLGTIGTSSGPVNIIESPTQIGVYDGVGGWVWDVVALTFTQVIPNAQTNAANPTAAIYQDGFGVVNRAGTNELYQSNYNDLSTYASLPGPTANFAYAQGNANNVVSLFDLRQEAWIFKPNAVEVWINQGSPGFAFIQLQGVSIPVGCVAPASVARLGDSAVWLGSSNDGTGIVYLSIGYQAKPITPAALAAIFQSYPVISDAIGYSYQIAGHYFYVITFPTQGVTWAYDLVLNRWTQRAYFSNGAFSRELANCHAVFNNMHVVGDYQNGNLYALDPSIYTDNGNPRKWLRSWRALPPGMPLGVPMSFDQLQVLLETGITVQAGSNPQIDLRYSDDGGYNWNGPWQVPAGKTGQTAWRAIQNRLGSTTIGRGMDRIWEISGNDPILIKITGAEWFGGPA